MLVLASASEIRARLLHASGVPFDIVPARVDEVGMRAAMAEEGLGPRDQADALAEAKARKVSARMEGRLVLGCDQILDHGGLVLSKPEGADGTARQLADLSGRAHRLISAAVIAENGRPIWRHVGELRLTMRPLIPAAIDAYLARNPSVIGSLGGYRLEEQGVRLFSQMQGDYFSGLGLPLVPLLGYLVEKGVIEP